MYINVSLVSGICERFVEKKSIWGTANAELYELCKKYPCHDNREQTVAKLWMIGRTYAAALERRQHPIVSTDELYTQVADALSLHLDKRLAKLKQSGNLSPANFAMMLSLHQELTEWFAVESEKADFPVKRSLASKYLHFHLPNVFPIYDANAAFAVSKLVSNREISDIISDVSDYERNGRERHSDSEYRNFCLKVLALQRYLGWQDLKRIDDFLLYCADMWKQAKQH